MQFLLVPVIIGCALGGTVGIIKLIGKTNPKMMNEDGSFKETKTAKKLHEAAEKNGKGV